MPYQRRSILKSHAKRTSRATKPRRLDGGEHVSHSGHSIKHHATCLQTQGKETSPTTKSNENQMYGTQTTPSKTVQGRTDPPNREVTKITITSYTVRPITMTENFRRELQCHKQRSRARSTPSCTIGDGNLRRKEKGIVRVPS
jgi:hypothetical protein